jgi:hypothetical protein
VIRPTYHLKGEAMISASTIESRSTPCFAMSFSSLAAASGESFTVTRFDSCFVMCGGYLT